MDKTELKNAIYTKKNKDLISFLTENFFYKKGKLVYEYKNKVNVINKLELSDIRYGIARMKSLDEEMDFFKTLPGILTLILAMIASYIALFDNQLIPKAIGLLGIMSLFWFIINSVVRVRKERAVIVLFRSLLEDAKDNKEKS
ncbi:hypothetical protein ACFT6Z_35855 [Streptomyces sp. NPDC057131]|uniref:hypothetical protein n=1 Tax=Streptomyces sp. NPDC057131 TaxID=3346027 RepID=UPI0036443F60